MQPRSTDVQPPLRLSYRRGEVFGLWVVLVVLCGALAVGTAAVTGWPASWLWPALAGIILAPGIVRRTWFEDAVWAWNGCVRRLAAALRWWVLAVSYLTVVSVTGRAGSPMRSDGAGWRAVTSDDRIVTVRTVLEYCRREHRWAMALLPVLALLAVLDERDRDSHPPSTNYTLY